MVSIVAPCVTVNTTMWLPDAAVPSFAVVPFDTLSPYVVPPVNPVNPVTVIVSTVPPEPCVHAADRVPGHASSIS